MLKKFSYIFDKKQKRKFIGLAAMIIIGAFAELLGVTAVLPFIQVVLNSDVIEENKYLYMIYSMLGFENKSAFLIFLALAIAAVYVAKNIFIYIMHSEQYRFTYENQRKLSAQMLDCYLNQPYLFHVNHNRAELMRNAGEDVRAFFEVVLASLQLASEGCVCAVLLIFLFVSDKTITLGVIGLVGIFGIVYIKVFKKRLKEAGEASRVNQENYQRILLEALGSIKEVKVSAREDVFLKKYDGETAEYAENNRKFKQYGMLPKPVMETICITGLLIIIAGKLAMGVYPEYFIPTISLFAVAAFRMLPSANRIAEYLSRILFSKPSIDAIYNDLMEVRNLQNNPEYKKRNSNRLVFKEKIEVDNLSFKYPAGEKDVLHQVSLEIPKNKSIALIGPTGQGKSTLADLILGLLTPDSGKIFVDGVDINTAISSWQELIGYIPQVINLMDATIKENILFGIPEEECDEEQLIRALKESQAYDFVMNQPEGLNTVIGEGGVRLSGGQRQRLGIARALYRNPEILIMDEATAALDNETEAAVMAAIDALNGTRTMIIIAHRLTTIRNCDLIFKVNEGKVDLTTDPI